MVNGQTMSQLLSYLDSSEARTHLEPGHTSITEQVLANKVDRLRLDGAPPLCGNTRMELPATQLRLPAALPYPLTVQRIYAQPGAHVQKTHRLFTYSFLPNKPDELGRRERQVRQWDSPVLGQVIAWDVREGDIIREPRSVFRPIQRRAQTLNRHFAGPSSKYRNRVHTMSNSTDSAQSAART